LGKKNSILAKASQVSDVAHGPLVLLIEMFLHTLYIIYIVVHWRKCNDVLFSEIIASSLSLSFSLSLSLSPYDLMPFTDLYVLPSSGEQSFDQWKGRHLGMALDECPGLCDAREPHLTFLLCLGFTVYTA
jgi:hypothetical protein